MRPTVLICDSWKQRSCHTLAYGAVCTRHATRNFVAERAWLVCEQIQRGGMQPNQKGTEEGGWREASIEMSREREAQHMRVKMRQRVLRVRPEARSKGCKPRFLVRHVFCMILRENEDLGNILVNLRLPFFAELPVGEPPVPHWRWVRRPDQATPETRPREEERSRARERWMGVRDGERDRRRAGRRMMRRMEEE